MIFITGCARSGTSLVTQILQAHGLNLGRPINGLYENTDVREKVLKPYFKSIGADPLGQHPLPDPEALPERPNLRDQVIHLIDSEEPWGYKDAKLALIWPMWAAAFPEAKWIVVRRDPRNIVQSCLATPFMRAFQDEYGWGNWIAHHVQQFARMREAGLEMIEVWPEIGVDDPKAFTEAVWFAGFRVSRETITACVDRRKWHYGGDRDRKAAP